jgi:hypothetical protein
VVLARAFHITADEGLRGVVSFSDPIRRVLRDGTVLSPGHVGTIYQAANGWHTAERGTPRTLLIGPDGRVLSAHALSKIRRCKRGREYAERQLVSYGARPRRQGQSSADESVTRATTATSSASGVPGANAAVSRSVWPQGRTPRSTSPLKGDDN